MILPGFLTSIFFLGVLFATEAAGLCFKRSSLYLNRLGGNNWSKTALVAYAVGASIPLLSIALSLVLYTSNSTLSIELIINTLIGINIINLSLTVGIILISGPLTFFRIRTTTSPIFLLLATLIFCAIASNGNITKLEAICLLILALAYALYFRSFSSEANIYHRNRLRYRANWEKTGLALSAIFFIAIGFFVCAVVFGFPFIKWFESHVIRLPEKAFQPLIQFIALMLSLPLLLRALFRSFVRKEQKAMMITSLTHACLLNILILPSLIALFENFSFSDFTVRFQLPTLMLLTINYVCILLIEKEDLRYWGFVLILAYLCYTTIAQIV